MAFVKLQFRPGINRDVTSYSNEGGWYTMDKVRFNGGFPKKIGGWTKLTVNTIIGVCRQMWNWVTSYTDNLLFVGTNVKTYLYIGSYYYDITPLRTTNPTLSSPDTDDCVYTSNGQTTVTITLAGPHAANTGSYVTIRGVTGDVGGVPDAEINANHKITVIDPNSFAITVTTAATSTVSGGGGNAIEIDFEIEPGYSYTVAGYGWGTGGWGREGWGMGSLTPIFLPQRDWFASNLDNDLVMNIRNGAPYYWARGVLPDPATALSTRAVRLQEIASDGGFDPDAVPVKVMQLMVSQQDKHVIAFGAVPFGSTDEDDFDPMLIRWASQDEPGQWEPEVTNSSGFIHVSRGSMIVRALPIRQETLVFTDSSIYSLQFLGTTDVFGLQEYADNISIISPRACISSSDVVYWMGKDKFYYYTGSVNTLDCTIHDYVFSDINLEQAAQVICGTNDEWGEIWWFYPSASSNWNDKYVVFNYEEKIWYYGSMPRTAWLDSPLQPQPVSSFTDISSETGLCYNQETGVDDDGAPMEAYIESSDFDVGDGEQFMLSRRLIPDVSFSGSIAASPELTMQLTLHRFPGSAYQTYTPDSGRVISTTVGQYTNQLFIRARSRQMTLKVISTGLGVTWQLGTPRFDVRPDGKR